MFDFSSAARHEGDTDGMNDKGLVARDRSTRKGAYFFYQANWTDRPMAHVVGSGVTSFRSSKVELKAYSNETPLTLTVNGQSYGDRPGSDTPVFLWEDVPLREGKKSHQYGTEDHCIMTLRPIQSVQHAENRPQ
jgi:beta-galactosidase